MSDLSIVLAQAAGNANAGGPFGGMGFIVMIIAMFGLMYFLTIRPQQKKQKEHDQMLTHIKAGDKVMTTCGIFGTVVKVSDKKVTIAIAEKVNVEFALAAVADILKDEVAAEPAKK